MANGEVIIDVGLDESKVTKGMKDLKGSFGKIGGIAGAAFAAIGVAGIGAIKGIVDATAELNTDLARLKTNAEVAGFGFEAMEDSMKKVAAVSGELDSAVETVSNLMATDFSENQLAEALDYVNGAAIRFSDTLNTEGIADGLQETFANGAEATGQFGELLERSGINLELFNEGLVEATDNGTATDYVLQTLADTGLKDTYDAYLESNKAITEYNEAQVDSQVKTAELGKKLTPLVTNFLELKNTLLDVALGNITLSDAFEKVTDGLGGFVTKMIDEGKKVLPEFVRTIVEKIPSLISTATDMINKLAEGIQKNMPSIAKKGTELSTTVISKILEKLPDLIVAGVKLVSSLVVGIIKSLPTVVSSTMQISGELIGTLLKSLPKLLSVGVDMIGKILSGLASALPKIPSFFLTSFIPSITRTISGGKWNSIGSDIISGIIKGINSMKTAAINAMTGVVNGVVNKAKSLLGINSPSKLFEQYGKWIDEGLEIGITKDSSLPVNATSDMVRDLTNEFTNPLKNATIGLGFADAHSSGVINNYNNTIEQKEIVATPVILNGKIVGELAFDYVNKKQQSSYSINSIVKGVT